MYLIHAFLLALSMAISGHGSAFGGGHTSYATHGGGGHAHPADTSGGGPSGG